MDQSDPVPSAPNPPMVASTIAPSPAPTASEPWYKTDLIGAVTVPLAIFAATAFGEWMRRRRDKREEKAKEEERRAEDREAQATAERREREALEREHRDRVLAAIVAASANVQRCLYLGQRRDTHTYRIAANSSMLTAIPPGAGASRLHQDPAVLRGKIVEAERSLEQVNRERVELAVQLNGDAMMLDALLGEEAARPLVVALHRFIALVEGEATDDVKKEVVSLCKMLGDEAKRCLKRV